MEKYNVTEYDRQLTRISEAIIEMGTHVEALVKLGLKAITTPSISYVAEAKAIDNLINTLDVEVEEIALTVLALRQPMAADLRTVTSALKMCGYLERMGDLAKSVTKKAKQPDITLPAEALKDFADVAEIIINMVQEVTAAFAIRDAGRALAAWRRDDEIDVIYRDLYHHIEQKIEQDPSHTKAYLRILSAAKNFERIGDYVAKVAASSYYIATGKRFDKHLANQKESA